MKEKVLLKVEDRDVAVTHLDKVLYPKARFTKKDVIDYYMQVGPTLLPHLKNRPVTFKRYPDGVDGFSFYEKQCPSHRPSWMRTAAVRKSDGTSLGYCLLNDLPSLVFAANLAALELHTFLHRAPALDRPTLLAFDLDPGLPAGLLACCEVGLALRQLLEVLGLQSFPKTSGSKGLQIYVPLNRPVTYGRTKALAHRLADLLEHQAPDLVVARMQKRLRTGKVFIDWSQNDGHKTTVSVYSLRAKDHPTVSTPLRWQEVETAVKKGDPQRLVFEADAVVRRIKKHGDLFSPVLSLRQALPPDRRIAELLGRS